jgi:hypothetical protein
MLSELNLNPNAANPFTLFLSKYVEIKSNTLQNVLLKIFLCALNNSPTHLTTKFQYLKTVLDNIFITPEISNEFLTTFSELQRHYLALSRFANYIKRKRSPLHIQHDLILNPIKQSQHNVMTILQSDQQYLFTVHDLTKIMNAALSHSPNFFSEPLAIKNPYNNVPFEKSTLYNIYFFIKHGDFVMPPLLHHYFLCNFDLTEFRDMNEPLIRKIYLENFVKTASLDLLKSFVFDMIHSLRSSVSISSEFPKDKLVTIMRPYLNMYMTSQYSLDISLRHKTRSELKKRLREFYEFNPRFGRKIIDTSSKTVRFDDKYISFYKKRNLLTSHVYVDESRDPSDDEEEDEEEEEEAEFVEF